MLTRQLMAPIFASVLRSLPSHKSRKRFAKFFGPYFSGCVATTAYGVTAVCDWYDNVNRMMFEGSYGVVGDFILSLPEGSLFIDIGANQGGTTLFASTVLGPRGHVLAYEPNPHTAELMKRNIALNGCENISVFVRGVGSQQLEEKLDISDGENSGAAHIAEEGIAVTIAPLYLRDIPTACQEGGIFVKIDTEGYEMEVLRGIEDLLQTKAVRKLCIEIDDVNLRSFGSSPSMVYDYLAERHFTPEYGLSPGHYDEVFHAQ